MKIWEGMAEIWCACMCEVVYGGMNVCFCVFVYEFLCKEWLVLEMNVCAKVCDCLIMLYIYIYIYIYMRLKRHTCAYIMSCCVCVCVLV